LVFVQFSVQQLSDPLTSGCGHGICAFALLLTGVTKAESQGASLMWQLVLSVLQGSFSEGLSNLSTTASVLGME
jgi:hypothetical protein